MRRHCSSSFSADLARPVCELNDDRFITSLESVELVMGYYQSDDSFTNDSHNNLLKISVESAASAVN